MAGFVCALQAFDLVDELLKFFDLAVAAEDDGVQIGKDLNLNVRAGLPQSAAEVFLFLRGELCPELARGWLRPGWAGRQRRAVSSWLGSGEAGAAAPPSVSPRWNR